MTARAFQRIGPNEGGAPEEQQLAEGPSDGGRVSLGDTLILDARRANRLIASAGDADMDRYLEALRRDQGLPAMAQAPSSAPPAPGWPRAPVYGHPSPAFIGAPMAPFSPGAPSGHFAPAPLSKALAHPSDRPSFGAIQPAPETRRTVLRATSSKLLIFMLVAAVVVLVAMLTFGILQAHSTRHAGGVTRANARSDAVSARPPRTTCPPSGCSGSLLPARVAALS